ncbi:MAG: asparagine--tRNA ligase [Candidatus Shikimatogenerans bostrichidophilus]|nr:MAG: asparagine--tRNA ligase [Candidatus Shikimatogenerans bostrichidophilus]
MYNIKYILKKKKEKKYIIKGWVKYFRNNIFLDINDGSTNKNLQVILKKKKFNKIKKKIIIGIPIKIYGKLIKIKDKYEILPDKIKILGKINKFFFNNSILQNKYHTLSKLRKQYHLRFRTNIFSAIMRIRHTMSLEIHNFFNKKNYYYIHTPIITNNNVEGGSEVFELKNKNKIFKDKVYLTVSGQLEAESAILGLKKVYTFGPVFRSENSNTNKHLSEFWMVEPEIMFYKLKDIMKLSVNIIKYLIKKILNKNKDDLNYLEEYHNKNKNKIGINLKKKLNYIIKKKFLKISYSKLIKLLIRVKKKIIKWGDDIKKEHEKIIFKKIFTKNLPLIVYNYPKKIKPFYMKINKDNLTVKSIDVLLPNVGEIIGGSERENTYDKLKINIKKKKIKEKKILWYLNLRNIGEINHSGFGLGFDRLVQFITGMKNIRDIIPYPIYPGKY